MKASTRQLEAVPETSEEQKNRADVAHILEEDEIKQIYRDRSAEDALDEAEDNEAAVEEEVDELEEEDDVVRAAQGSRNLTP
ncbi:MAG: hypothetical protein ABSC76_00070 [Terracidiphilus sp.]|jgi:hypothetical protein